MNDLCDCFEKMGKGSHNNGIRKLSSSVIVFANNLLVPKVMLLGQHKISANFSQFLLFVTAVHVVAHVFNVQLFISSWQENGVTAVINQLADVRNQTYLNPIRDEKTVSRFYT